jgi:hypothetical protein
MADLQLSIPESPSGSDLGTFRSNDNYYIPITAYDPSPELGPVIYGLIDLADGGTAVRPLLFDNLDGGGPNDTYATTASCGSAVASDTWLPPNLHLDYSTGYIFGYVPLQTEYLKKYHIGISATKIASTSTTTVNTFTLGILNNDPDIITWSGTNTITITEGLISELSLLATHKKSQSTLQYSFVGTNTPFFGGFTLTNSGNIVGQSTASGIFTATVVAWNPYFPIDLLDGGLANQPQDYDLYGGSAVSTGTHNYIDLDGGSSLSKFIMTLHDTDGGSAASKYSINDPATDGGASASVYGINEKFIDGGITTSIFINYDVNGGYAATAFSEQDAIADSGHAQFIPIFDPSLVGPTYPYAFSTQTLTINITPSAVPYTGIYVRPFLSIEKRKSYSKFINDTTIFPENILYRSDDPNFGLQKNIKMFLEFGIQELNLRDYIPALWENFNRRRLYFGNVKTARAQDQLGNYLYDVVYVDIIDNIAGVKPTIYDRNNILYPASIENMRTQLLSIILPDYTYIGVDQYHLPKFMQIAQPGTYLPTNYITVVPLCYVLPGKSSIVVDQIKLSGFDFKLYDFEIDRLVVQNSLDNTTDKYIIFPRRNLTSTIPQDNLIFIDPTTSTSFITDDSGNLLLRN